MAGYMIQVPMPQQPMGLAQPAASPVPPRVQMASDIVAGFQHGVMDPPPVSVRSIDGEVEAFGGGRDLDNQESALYKASLMTLSQYVQGEIGCEPSEETGWISGFPMVCGIWIMLNCDESDIKLVRIGYASTGVLGCRGVGSSEEPIPVRELSCLWYGPIPSAPELPGITNVQGNP